MIRIREIYKSFDNKDVLNGTTINIEQGNIYGLVGKNGAGKTTLLSIIAGLSNPNKGQIMCDSDCRIGFLPDVPEYFDTLSADEYIEFLLKEHNYEKRNSVLRTVHIDGSTLIKNMSRGMKQRIGIAALLINDPDIILLDEPTSALDPEGRQEVLEVLKHLKKQGKTIILSTHILNDMEKICDYVGFLVDGKIIKEVSMNSAFQDMNEIEIILSDKEEDLIEFNDLQFVKNNNVYKIKIKDVNDQKLLFQELSKLGNRVISIKSTNVNLDELFNEVCR